MLLDQEWGQRRFPRTETLSKASEATLGDEDWGILEHSWWISSTYLEQVRPCDFFCLALNISLLRFDFSLKSHFVVVIGPHTSIASEITDRLYKSYHACDSLPTFDVLGEDFEVTRAIHTEPGLLLPITKDSWKVQTCSNSTRTLPPIEAISENVTTLFQRWFCSFKEGEPTVVNRVKWSRGFGASNCHFLQPHSYWSYRMSHWTSQASFFHQSLHINTAYNCSTSFPFCTFWAYLSQCMRYLALNELVGRNSSVLLSRQSENSFWSCNKYRSICIPALMGVVPTNETITTAESIANHSVSIVCHQL